MGQTNAEVQRPRSRRRRAGGNARSVAERSAALATRGLHQAAPRIGHRLATTGTRPIRWSTTSANKVGICQPSRHRPAPPPRRRPRTTAARSERGSSARSHRPIFQRQPVERAQISPTDTSQPNRTSQQNGRKSAKRAQPSQHQPTRRTQVSHAGATLAKRGAKPAERAKPTKRTKPAEQAGPLRQAGLVRQANEASRAGRTTTAGTDAGARPGKADTSPAKETSQPSRNQPARSN